MSYGPSEELDRAVRKTPLNTDTKKQVETIQKSPEFKLILLDKIVSELKKDKENTENRLEAYYKAKALAELIQI